jgi:hypothetical protein
MKTKILRLLVLSLILSSLLLISCENTTNSTPTITISADSCSYSGPKTVGQKFNLTVTNTGDTYDSYGYIIGTMDKSKNIDDLAAWTSSDQPPWFTIQKSDEFPAAKITHYDIPYDLSDNASYRREPIYIVCFISGEKVGQAGPIKVK